MQAQIAENPAILPLHEIREGAELVAVVREFSVASGSVDLLGFDAEGELYIIETRLARNPDRRTVVAQALDYGAALWSGYPDPALFFTTIDGLLTRAGRPNLLDALRSAHDGNESAAAEARDRIARNLASGAFRFVIPMDRIDDGLKDLVQYVNENSRLTVYPLELEQYQAGDVTVIVPRLFGAETRKTVAGMGSGSRGAAGSLEEFVADFECRVADGTLGSRESQAVRGMLRLVTDRDAGYRWHSSTGGRVSVSPRFPTTGAARSPFTLRSDGRLAFNLKYVRDVPAWRQWGERVLALLNRAGEPWDYPEFRPDQWVPQAEAIIAATREVLNSADRQSAGPG